MSDMLSALMTVPWMSLFGKRPAQRSATICIGLITKRLGDNTTEELLEPGSSEDKIPNLKNV